MANQKLVTVPARGANCSKKKEEKENSEKLQSPQGARIVATIMLKYCRKTFIF